MHILNEYENEIENILSYKIDKLIAGLTLFFEKDKNKLKSLYAYDIFFKGGIKENYLKEILNTKFKNLLSVSIVEIYDYISQKYIPDSVRIKTKINSSDLAGLIFNNLKKYE